MKKKLMLAGKIFLLSDSQGKKLTNSIKPTHIVFDDIILGEYPSYVLFAADGFEKNNKFSYSELVEILKDSEVVDRNSSSSKEGKKSMAKLSAIMKTIVDKDLRNGQKLGYLDASLKFTDEGIESLLAIFFKTNKKSIGEAWATEAKNKSSKKCKKSDDCED